MYHAAMGAMQGQGPQEIYDRICDLLMDMQKAQWVRIHQSYDRYHHDSNSRTNYKNEFISPSSPFASFFLQAFWIPVQLINFNFVPVRHQLNVVLLTSVVWTALLSMWYPPIEAKTPEVTKPE